MNDSSAGLHVILCEGYDDRSFWSGWLERRGCVARKGIPDVYGKPVVKGRYHFITNRGSSVIIRPYRGRANLSRAFRDEMVDNQTYPRRRVVINLDSDAEDGSSGAGARDAVRQIARDHNVEIDDPTAGSFDVDDVSVSAVIWECSGDAGIAGVPGKQTLERLVSAAIQAAYPGRGDAVERWLEDQPRTTVGHKNYGFSYLAKWYADHGCDDFYRALWRDEKVVVELRRRLEATGAWAVVEALVAD